MANEQSCCVKLPPFTFFFSSFFFFICEFCKVPRCLRFHCLLLLFFPLHPKRQKKERKKVQLKLAGRFTHTHWRGFFFFAYFTPRVMCFHILVLLVARGRGRKRWFGGWLTSELGFKFCGMVFCLFFFFFFCTMLTLAYKRRLIFFVVVVAAKAVLGVIIVFSPFFLFVFLRQYVARHPNCQTPTTTKQQQQKKE